jgi:hypothetical protein
VLGRAVDDFQHRVLLSWFSPALAHYRSLLWTVGEGMGGRGVPYLRLPPTLRGSVSNYAIRRSDVVEARQRMRGR